MTIVEALKRVRDTLEDTTPEARLEAEVLVMHQAGLSRAQLYGGSGDLTPPDLAALEAFAKRRKQGEPLAYILGHREFYGLDFLVDRRVLIPRSDTEALVELALAWLRERDAARLSVADIGTGSGAIAVSLTANLPRISIIATDISSDVLEVAAANARCHGVAERVQLQQGDLLLALPGPVDLLLANLPYVPEMQLPAWCGAAQVELAWEPLDALAGGPDGLQVIRRLLGQAPAYLRPGGAMLLEIGWDQGAAVRQLAAEAFPTAEVTVQQDLGGRDRVVVVQLPDGPAAG